MYSGLETTDDGKVKLIPNPEVVDLYSALGLFIIDNGGRAGRISSIQEPF
ncbi:MAG: hypothetical protein R3A12_06160 [Ignavibacteria bacterium]